MSVSPPILVLMSVTFSIDSVGTGKYEFVCYGGDERQTFGPYEDRANANEYIDKHVGECSECSIYRPYANEIQDVDFDMNVSNSNAGMLFGVLGMEADWCGAMDAEEFLGYVLVALGMPLEDSGVAPTEFQSKGEDGLPNGPRIVECGIPAGYVEKRLTVLAEMASEAKRLGRRITWG